MASNNIDIEKLLSNQKIQFPYKPSNEAHFKFSDLCTKLEKTQKNNFILSLKKPNCDILARRFRNHSTQIFQQTQKQPSLLLIKQIEQSPQLDSGEKQSSRLYSRIKHKSFDLSRHQQSTSQRSSQQEQYKQVTTRLSNRNNQRGELWIKDYQQAVVSQSQSQQTESYKDLQNIINNVRDKAQPQQQEQKPFHDRSSSVLIQPIINNIIITQAPNRIQIKFHHHHHQRNKSQAQQQSGKGIRKVNFSHLLDQMQSRNSFREGISLRSSTGFYKEKQLPTQTYGNYNKPKNERIQMNRTTATQDKFSGFQSQRSTAKVSVQNMKLEAAKNQFNATLTKLVQGAPANLPIKNQKLDNLFVDPYNDFVRVKRQTHQKDSLYNNRQFM